MSQTCNKVFELVACIMLFLCPSLLINVSFAEEKSETEKGKVASALAVYKEVLAKPNTRKKKYKHLESIIKHFSFLQALRFSNIIVQNREMRGAPPPRRVVKSCWEVCQQKRPERLSEKQFGYIERQFAERRNSFHYRRLLLHLITRHPDGYIDTSLLSEKQSKMWRQILRRIIESKDETTDMRKVAIRNIFHFAKNRLLLVVKKSSWGKKQLQENGCLAEIVDTVQAKEIVNQRKRMTEDADSLAEAAHREDVPLPVATCAVNHLTKYGHFQVISVEGLLHSYRAVLEREKKALSTRINETETLLRNLAKLESKNSGAKRELLRWERELSLLRMLGLKQSVRRLATVARKNASIQQQLGKVLRQVRDARVGITHYVSLIKQEMRDKKTGNKHDGD